jgi:hypothetical protein
MKRRIVFALMIGFFILVLNTSPQAVGLPTEIKEGTVVTWKVNVAPRNITNMYYSGGGNMLAENDSLMSCSIDSIGDDTVGLFTIGNVSITANDTEIARDLVLGVWGTPTEWWPGLFIKTGSSNIENLNASAYAAAQRVSGNYLNGTMISRYENITISLWNSTTQTYESINEPCITFDYEQDPPLFGDAQITHLSYSLSTGILVMANTSYSFGVPYYFAISLSGVALPLPNNQSEIPQIILYSTIIIVVLIALYIRFGRD